MKRMMCAVLAWVLMLGCARAEFAPLLDAYETEYENGRALRCTVTAEVNELASASDQALLAVQNQLSKLALDLSVQAGDEKISMLTLSYDGEDMLTLGSRETDEGTQVLLGGDVYATSAGETDALSLLAGSENNAFPYFEKGREALWACFDQMYQVLGSHGTQGELVKATTSIQNVGASGRYIPYKLDEAGMNQAWQELYPLFAGVLDALYPDGCEAQKDLLSALRFSGDTEIRRIRDKEETDWGFRATAHVSLGEGVQHKVTALVAWRPDRGFCVDIKAPAVEGDDTLKVLFSGAYTMTEKENKLQMECSFTHRKEGQTAAASLEGTVRYTVQETGARLHGKLTCKKNDETCVVKPDLLCTQDAVQGTVDVSQDSPKGDSAYVLHVNAAWTDGLHLEGENTVSLADMENWEKTFILRDVEKEWTDALIRVMAKIPGEERALITHVLRSDAWFDREESVPVPENGNFRRVEEELVE